MTDVLAKLFWSAGDSEKISIAIVVAHPDDEVIGAGVQLRKWPHAHVIYITDGAPKNLADARNAGFTTARAYAAARKIEGVKALKLAGISEQRIYFLNFPDQEASLNLVSLTQKLAVALAEIQPAIILTQPYEGGHPDHDATAFAVHVARAILEKQTASPPEILEMTAYHNRNGELAAGEFLPYANTPVITIALTPEEREFKRQLFAQFTTQQNVLQYFPIEPERFRRAPRYDFTAPPHSGKLYYELFDWGMTGARWRILAAEALRKLDFDYASAGKTESAVQEAGNI